MVASVPTLTYERRRPARRAWPGAPRNTESVLYKAVRRHWPTILAELRQAQDGDDPPKFLVKAVQAYEKCGVLKYVFCRVLCSSCRKDQLLAWSCKARGICTSCDAKRMTELAVPAFAVTLSHGSLAALDAGSPLGRLGHRRRPGAAVCADPAIHAPSRAGLERRVSPAGAIGPDARPTGPRIRQAKSQGLQDPKFAAFSVLQRWNGALRMSRQRRATRHCPTGTFSPPTAPGSRPPQAGASSPLHR